MKKIYQFLLMALFFIPATGMAQGNGQGRPKIGHIYGKVLDAQTGKPVEFASVSLINPKDSSVVDGMLTQGNGDFSIEHLPFGKFVFRIQFLGYQHINKNISITPANADQDLGNFNLKPSAASLKTVNVTAQKSTYTMGIDKKTFNVGSSLASTGGTAEDVLKQVPSVNVDIDGNVTVRNGSPKIFIDGKPTSLTMDEIPADAIDKIEVITNPSAKYDAEGMSGIINIVLKKNHKVGYNGMIMAGAGTHNQYNAGGNLNVRENKINVSLNYNLHTRTRPENGTTDRHNLLSDSYLEQNSHSNNNGLFQFGQLGIDYFMDNRNTISVSQGLFGGHFDESSVINSDYLDDSKSLDSSSIRNTTGGFDFHGLSSQLSYKHTFTKKDEELTADFTYRNFKNGRDGDYNTHSYNQQGEPLGITQRQTNNGSGLSNHIVGQIDYVDPINKKSKLEAGLKTTVRNSNSDYNVYDMDPSLDKFRYDSVSSSDYKFNEHIYAGYAQFSSKINKFNYQLGLRAEQYTYDGKIPSEDLSFKPSSDKLGLFPSVYLTQDLGNSQQLQLNYSRRIDRPNFWERIPYTDYSDQYNLRKGNPDLKPEYTNSFEFSYNNIFGQNNLLATLYFRNTNNEITNYTEPFNNSTDTLIRYAVNADVSNSYGAEFTLKNQLTNWWDITTNLNLFQTNINANSVAEGLSNSKFSWFAKINSNTTLPANIILQLTGNYEAPRPEAQGTSKGFGGVDAALKKDFLKKKNASITLSVSDIFNTQRYESYTEIPDVYTQDVMRKRVSRIFRINFMYRFGKFDTSIFKRKNKNNQNNNNNNDMDMGAPTGEM